MKFIQCGFLFCALSGLFACSASPDQAEVVQSISNKIGVSSADIKEVSKCFFTMPESKSSKKADWFPCVVAETNDSISLLTGGELVFMADFTQIESIGFPKNRANHEVQILKGESFVSFQYLKKFDLIDEEAGEALFERMKSKGISVNDDAVRIIHGHDH